jgi:hypothetical protein
MQSRPVPKHAIALMCLVLGTTAAPCGEPAKAVGAWVHDYRASDTFGPQIFAVRPLDPGCKTRLGFHLTSRRLFTTWYAQARKSRCR